MDLTWSFYIKKYSVRFVPSAVCYPIEPNNYSFMSKQLKRWSHGFAQNVILHWREVVHIPYLRSAVAVAVWDSSVASLVYITALPILSIVFWNPLFLIGYFIDAPVLIVPVLIKARRLKQTRLALMSFPSFFVLRIVNCLFIIEAFWSEFILRKRLMTYEKGH
jgi:biofilm PGA synthesis N-glycosyltransferase PgaC